MKKNWKLEGQFYIFALLLLLLLNDCNDYFTYKERIACIISYLFIFYKMSKPTFIKQEADKNITPMNQAWRLWSNPNTLLAKFLNQKHCQTTNFLHTQSDTGFHSWKALIRGRNLLQKGRAGSRYCAA